MPHGLYLSDTPNLTPRLALTLSGRFNAAKINLNDQNGGDLTGNHSYKRALRNVRRVLADQFGISRPSTWGD
jgi:hypothetical protein